MLTLRFPQVSDFMVNQFKTMQTKKKPKQTNKKQQQQKSKNTKNRNKNNKLVITERNAFCC